jgi:uncharacterized protein (DUF2235 family)
MAPRNIIVCCDGTGNQFGDANSNVVKLYTACLINKEQVGYYHPGVGTMGAPQARSWLTRKTSVLRGLAFATGFMDNVEDAYRYLMGTYKEGDRIFLFGFSRGSYTVRALAAILQAYGLLCKGNEGHIPYLLRLFQQDMKAARTEARLHRERRTGRKKTVLDAHPAFKQTFCHDVIIHFAGIWDTVSSVGWITQPFRLLYSAQNPIIQTGRHAVSIDERRCFYQDNLWGPALPMQQTPTLGEKHLQEDGSIEFRPEPQDILQVWFAGVHSDIGGSYPQHQSALSNRALRWLLDEAIAHGLLVKQDRVHLIFGLPTQESYAAASLFRTPVEPGRVHPSLSGAWWLLEVLPHRSYVMDTDQEHWRIPLGRSRRLPTGAIVHPSVIVRMADAQANYKPRNLPINSLEPCPSQQPGTAADLSSFYRHLPVGSEISPASRSNPTRPIAGVVAFLTAFATVLLTQSIRGKQHSTATVEVVRFGRTNFPEKVTGATSEQATTDSSLLAQEIEAEPSTR